MRPVRPATAGTRAQVGPQCVRIGRADARVGVIGKGRVEQPAVARAAVVQRAPEVGGAPCADAGVHIGRQVRAVDGAEGRGDATPAGVGRGASRRVAILAVAGARQVGTAFDLRRAWVGRRRLLATVAAHIQPPQRRRHQQQDAAQRGQHTRHRTASMLPQCSGAGAGAAGAARAAAGTGCAANQCASAFTSCGLQAPGDLRHAVRRLGTARAGAPRAELRVQVVHRQTQQAGHVLADSGQGRAVAGLAGGDAARRVTLLRQRLAQTQRGRVGAARRAGRVGQVQPGKVAGNLAQEGVVQRRQQVGHQRIGALAIPEGAQLAEQVAGRLAGDARVVAVAGGAPVLAVAAGAGQQALRHRVLEGRHLGQRHRRRQHRDGPCPAQTAQRRLG